MINTQLLKAPFPYFGGKSGATAQVWDAFGDVACFVEPFAGSAAMLLGAPEGKRIETAQAATEFMTNKPVALIDKAQPAIKDIAQMELA